MKNNFSEGNIMSILANPVYIGLGPFPQIIEEEMWISVNEKFIKEHGALKFLSLMVENLRKYVPYNPNATIEN